MKKKGQEGQVKKKKKYVLKEQIDQQKPKYVAKNQKQEPKQEISSKIYLEKPKQLNKAEQNYQRGQVKNQNYVQSKQVYKTNQVVKNTISPTQEGDNKYSYHQASKKKLQEGANRKNQSSKLKTEVSTQPLTVDYTSFPQAKKVYRTRDPSVQQKQTKQGKVAGKNKKDKNQKQANSKQNKEKEDKSQNLESNTPKAERPKKKYQKYQKDRKYENRQEAKVELEDKGLEDKSKKLKKIFLELYTDASDIRIYASKYYPVIYFQYYQNNDFLTKKRKYLTEILREKPKIKQKRSLFEEVFERAFLKVDKKHYNISVFLIEQAKERHVNITKDSIFNLDQGCDVMFYYMKGKENRLNFIVFDRFMRNVETNSKQIEYLESKHPDQYTSFLKFKKKIFVEEDESHTVDLFNNQEVESDEDERPNFEEKSIQQLKEQLYRIADKNIIQIEEKIQKLNDQLYEQAQKDTNSNKYKILQEKIEDLQSGLDLFTNTRDNFLDQLPNNLNSKDFHKKHLKKMIIAQKQLENGLPIIGKKRIILQMLRKKNLLIIEGQTGSGKSTQLPQILCEYYELFDKPNAKPVLVTQPRRLATRSLAQRVASQMGETVGGFVDYVASAGKKVNKDAKIIFKLDRIVLDELTEDPVLSQYSCLVIDEAHQRTISIDVILGLIKKLLQSRTDFKVIVTSASMDIQLFEDYFKTKTLKVSGRMYPVTIKHMDFKNFYEGDKFQTVRKIQKVINEQILSPSGGSMKNEYKGHLLCFCSQIEEINKLVQIYEKKLNKNMFEVFALHGKITPSEQRKVFQEVGKHKIIFGNRIAETAITIDGVKVVIDPGNDIELVYDQKYKYSSMKLQEITKSSAKQRAGRAGRTGPGYCFRLYSQNNFSQRPVNKIPEIQNSSLETVVLRLKTLRIKDVINFQYISPPSKEGLKTSLQLLTLIGALKPGSQEVTKIGHLLVKIPIQPFLSRAIVESLMFDKIIKNELNSAFRNMHQSEKQLLTQYGLPSTIIAILALTTNFSNLFFIVQQDREKGEENKFYQFSDEEGDFFFIWNIYTKFLRLKEKGRNQSQNTNNYKNKQLSTWIRNNYLNFKAFNQTEQLIKEITMVASDFEINLYEYRDEIDNIKSKARQCTTFREVVLSCLVTSFSANLCKFSNNNHLGYTMVNQRKPLRLYGTSNLQLLGKQPEWIVCYDLYTNDTGRLYCKLAHQVTYDFLKKHLDKFVWKRFDIQGIQKKSPFYKQIQRQFPTILLQRFKQDYSKSQKQQRFTFLRDSYPLIVEQRSRITFFLELKYNEEQNIDIEENFNYQLTKYQISIINETMDRYRHNYIGNIFVSLFDGFNVQKIQYDNRQFCYEIIGPTSLIQKISSDCQLYQYRHLIEETDNNRNLRKQNKSQLKVYEDQLKIKVFVPSISDKTQFQNYLNVVNFESRSLKIKETILDKRRKIPKTKIFFYFFAGTSNSNNLYAHYQFQDYDILKAEDMCQLIKQGIMKERGISKLKPYQIRLSKARNGLNIRCEFDEYEIAEQLFRMDKKKLFGVNFKMPKFIRRFREPQISQATKKNEQWAAQLNALFQKSKIKTQNITLYIRGHYRADKKEKLSQLEKSFRVDMIAQITTLDSTVLNKLKRDYDGKTGVIGCQKSHIRAVYQQLLGTASLKAYDSLKEQYQREVDIFKHEYPLLNIHPAIKKLRGQDKVFIYAHSPNRQDFPKPMRIISNLFTPKLIRLQESQFKFLDKIKEGKDILDDIQAEYKYKIYFGFDRWTTTLKVYCDDHLTKEIETKVKKQIQKYKCYSEKISYRGKNLNKVKQILDNYLKNNSTSIMSYEIKFQYREILLTGDIQTLEFLKNQLLKLVNSDKKECNICADIMKTPYKLIICGCCFCWLCLTEHIRAHRNSPGTDLLRCPNEGCKKDINIYDVKNLLSEQEFNKMCDIKINKYLQVHKDKYLACNFCQNVFEKEEILKAGEINCEICGKSECLKCKESHPNYTCEEWKNRASLDLEKLGIKQCPRCKTGITKNGGCNHMQCTSCKAHICWKCLRVFTTSKPCYDHLARQCGGIFDPGAAY